MNPRFGLAREVYKLNDTDKADISEMTNLHRILLYKEANCYTIVSNPKAALNLNLKMFQGKAIVLTRVSAITEYPQYFYAEPGKFKKYCKKKQVSFLLPPELAEYVKSKGNISSYMQRLIELERNGYN